MDKRARFTRRLITGAMVLMTGGLGLPVVFAGAQQSRDSAATLETLAAKVKQLEDVQAITAVLVEYGRALDSRDFTAYSNLFTRDGSWSGGMGKVSGGPQAIYDFMTSRIGGGRNANAGGRAGNSASSGGRQGRGAPGSSYHIMSNFDIDVNGDTATASSRWTFITAARGPGIQVAGRYEDRLVRENGVWKIQSRQAFNDVTVPAASAGAGTGATGSAPATPSRER